MISKVEVSEKPILFSTSMVRAILDGKKTQTRRVINPQPAMHLEPSELPDTLGQWFDEYGVYWRCPYGRPGDQLWVRETWALICDNWPCECESNEFHHYEYKADSGDPYPGQWPVEEALGNPEAPRWRPSIFMPRDACRIRLEIINIRVERVQEIHRRDAQAEGVLCSHCYGYSGRSGCTCVDKFSVLWESINVKRGFGWESNPWVWVVDFKKTNDS